ncbi:MAG: DUF2294 domain-containing protein [Tumebacillaceae bacterium]|jgi:uncharacterized protein YbcI
MGQISKSKMEADISEAYIKFQREILGRGPQETKTYILKDMVIVRLKGVLTHEEKHLVKTERGRQLVKELRQILREHYSGETEGIISSITGCKVLSSHSDISTKMGERVEMFILDSDLEKSLKEKE